MLEEVTSAVKNINEYIYEQTKSEYLNLNIETDACNINIKWLGILLWNDDDDGRIYTEGTNSYELLETYLIRKMEEELSIIKKIKL